MKVDSKAVDARPTFIASRALLGIVARSLVDALQQVTLPQFRVLVMLSASGPMRMGAIAAQMGSHPSTFSRTVDRLVSGGWVQREINRDSRRETLLQLTPAGASLVEDVSTRRYEEIARILARLTPDEQSRVRDALELFAAAAGEPNPADLLMLGL